MLDSWKTFALPVGLAALGACGARPAARAAGAPAAASAPAVAAPASSDAPAAASAEPAAAPPGIPTECTANGDVCVPDGKWVTRLCQEVFPGVALVMFAKGSPWTRAYLTRKTKAWNASGGASVEGELEFDEEVLVLRKRAADLGGMQISGAGGGYDALRWDGSCVTLSADEVTLRSPPAARSGPVSWKAIDDGLREALRADPKVDAAYRAHRAECKGVTMGTVSQRCVKADADLQRAIVGAVRSGASLPSPQRMP
ncbi:MAG: hypothetical protein IT376_20945 [Polyangiaceae bacterium]|nr:hypothetical protein [Polyangiaceae bacterium]